jgi:hypothetical protein
MGHEMSHVILRHGTNQASKANLLQLPALLAGAMVENDSMLGRLATAGIGLGANSVLLRFSRSAESQADLLGSHIMADAGYDPRELARFFEKLNSQSGAHTFQFLSDHPNPDNREKAIEAEARTLPAATYGYQSGDFNKVKSLAASLPAPTKKSTLRSDATAPAQAPNGEWRQLNGQDYNVSYPGSWQALGGGNSSMVTLVPQDGLVKGQNGNTAIGYGAILSYFFPDSKTASLRNATDDLVHHLASQNPGMQVKSAKPRRVKVSGRDGLVTTLGANSPYGGAETDTLLTVSRPEGLFYLVFIAPERGAPNQQDTFQRMMDSIQFR